MQVGLGAMNEADDERLRFAAQLGVPNVVLHYPLVRGDGYWEFADLLRLRTLLESYGLKLAAIENLPQDHYDRIMLGAPGRDEQVEKVRTSVRNMGRAGIPVLGYHFMLNGVWRTEVSPTGRGGAAVSKYDHRLAERAPGANPGVADHEALWSNLFHFLDGVLPVAEEEGVRLALHPDDPPVLEIAGTPRIIGSLQAYRRLAERYPTPANAIEFCQGTVSEMCERPEQVYDAIREFGNRIAYVHFRNVRGAVPTFEETFIDEGKVDMLEAMRAYRDVGFEGVLIPDHTPHVAGDTRWGHRGRAYAVGYIKALIRCVEAEGR